MNERVLPIQPHAARKRYVCPGCTSAIEPGTYHVVVIPELEPDLRRHWHRGCWFRDHRRRNGKSVDGGQPADLGQRL